MSPEDINSQQDIKKIVMNLNDNSSSTESIDDTGEIVDEEAILYQGYEMLPSAASEVNEDTSESESEADELSDNLEQCILSILDSNELSGFGQQIDFSEPVPDTTQSDVWNLPTNNDIELTTEKLRTIEQCMANIKLDHIKAPEWAKNIPENEWKENVLKHIIMKQ